MYAHDIKQLCDSLGNPELPKQTSVEHNAINDAIWNKNAYEFLMQINNIRQDGYLQFEEMTLHNAILSLLTGNPEGLPISNLIRKIKLSSTYRNCNVRSVIIAMISSNIVVFTSDRKLTENIKI